MSRVPSSERMLRIVAPVGTTAYLAGLVYHIMNRENDSTQHSTPQTSTDSQDNTAFSPCEQGGLTSFIRNAILNQPTSASTASLRPSSLTSISLARPKQQAAASHSNSTDDNNYQQELSTSAQAMAA